MLQPVGARNPLEPFRPLLSTGACAMRSMLRASGQEGGEGVLSFWLGSRYFLSCVGVCALLGATGAALARTARRVGVSIALLFCMAPACYGILSRFPVLEARLFPWIDYLYFRSLWPAAAIIPLAVFARHLSSRRSRRALALAALFMFVLVLVLCFESIFLTRYTLAGARDDDGVAIQTYKYTCAAAAMVTLLDRHGIESSEGEMATLAVTRVGRGASDLGILRALTLKTRGTGLKVAIVRADYPELLHLAKPLLVSMRHDALYDHALVVLKAEERSLVVADPSAGRTARMRSDFELGYRGHAFIIYRNSRHEDRDVQIQHPAGDASGGVAGWAGGCYSGRLTSAPSRRSRPPSVSRKSISSITSRVLGHDARHLSFTR